MKYNLTGKAVALTGGSRGIGRAVAERLAREGARVAIIARHIAGLEETAALIRAEGGIAFPIRGDIRDDESVEQAIKAAARELGGIDVFLNVAGITLEKTMEEAVPEDFRRLFETNVLGVVRCNRSVLPHLKRSRGVLVHVSSIIVQNPFPRLGVYGSSKWAMAAYSHTLRQELHGTGVRVLNVYPTVVRTDLLKREPVLAGAPSQSAEKCAESIVRSIKRGRQEAGTAFLPVLSRIIFALHPPWMGRINRLLMSDGDVTDDH